MSANIREFLTIESLTRVEDDFYWANINLTPDILANQNYFNHSTWAQLYFETCHRDDRFRQRWLSATGEWDNKVIVDIGCGPGNLYANIGGKPKLLIGVDIAEGSLKIAQSIGYTPISADAHQIPLISNFADLVVLNAALHHCSDMTMVLAEAARLVRPGGKLIVDHDPQLSAWNYRGLGLFLYRIRLKVIYRLFLRRLHRNMDERLAALETEIHHVPGRGVTSELFYDVLSPLGFDVHLFPHNNYIGSEALSGIMGSWPHWRYPIGQILSGMNPFSKGSALSLMCVAIKKE